MMDKRKTLWRIACIGLIVMLMITFISTIIIASVKNKWYYINTTDAIYKGFIINNEHTYPIIEIDGVEYIAQVRQSVRDSSYIGEQVKIKYNTDYRDFKVIWSE